VRFTFNQIGRGSVVLVAELLGCAAVPDVGSALMTRSDLGLCEEEPVPPRGGELNADAI
jgi:hypothetical protein